MIFSHVLYQLSYLARKKKPPEPETGTDGGDNGRGIGVRHPPRSPPGAGSTYRTQES